MDGPSILKDHGKAIVDAIRRTAPKEWKVLVIDEAAKRIIDSSVNEDDILNHNIANIERIEDRREMNPDMDALYILSPQPHIVDCLLADFECRRYRRGFILWTGSVPDALQRRLDGARRQMAAPPELLFVDFYPRESHLITFRDPSSFLVLYNPLCNDLVARHLRTLASKIASICITLQEMPKIRYYQPPEHTTHEARVMCMHLARFVQQELEGYQQWDRNFPPPSQRPQSVLLITDRSADLMAPLLHEFTYQAMAHDLLPIKDQEDGKVTFHMTFKEKTAEAEEKDMELVEKDTVWVNNRHRHMKDTIDKLMGDFKKFLDQNPNFAGKDTGKTSLNDIRDMLAGLPQFQEMKQAYSLHLTMAQEAMNIFEKYKLADLASVEQTLATGLDDDYKKPKNVLDQVVRLLDDPDVAPADRLRLIAAYALYRDGMIDKDLTRLLWHASLQRSRDSQDLTVIENLDLLGARPLKDLKEARQPLPPLFPPTAKPAIQDDEYALSRFEPAVKQMLEHVCAGDLDPALFPYVVPPADMGSADSLITPGGSLRSAAPRWASANRRQAENRQRVIVFVAGGATYSEARACYEVSEKHSRDVFLATSHMVTPGKFIADLRVLKADRRRLDLPMDRPPPRAPAHLFERPAPPPPPQQQPKPMGMPSGGGGGGAIIPPRGGPPTKALAGMTLNSHNSSGGGGGPPSGSSSSLGVVAGGGGSGGDLRPGTSGSDVGGKKKDKEKKKRNIFGIKK
ncbi:protein transport protein sec1 [Chaetomidium leptoderma]|uniref:Protein transport protein sec1 n=1 Tax=Chaetomidium leptoderma TaxID=669021 RepID=A0AAN6VSJ9_9PEZI|nr:protein transport protein sec1 [Chaetomidium leptoderma]